MKTKHITPVFLLLLLTACSVGVKQDLLNGMAVEYKGFSMEGSSVTVDGAPLIGTQVPVGSKLAVYLEDLRGFKEVDGMAFPGCAIKVVDAEGTVMLESEDLFAAYTDGVSTDDAAYLNASVTVGEPMVAGQSYTWTARFWDKKNESAHVNTKMEFTTVE